MKRYIVPLVLVAACYTGPFPIVSNGSLVARDASVFAQDDDDDEECPEGFEESEDKCTPEEREEGCKDVRLDNGKGCVSR